MLKAERLEKEAFALLTLEQRAKFDEDEALIRRDRETQNTLRAEVRAAKKRKRDAVEEVKIRLVEKEAKDNTRRTNSQSVVGLNLQLFRITRQPRTRVRL